MKSLKISVVLAAVGALLTPCFGQDRGGSDSRVTLPLITNILGAAHRSGSIEYWGRCDSDTPYSDFPRVRVLADYSGAPLQVLQKMFADDLKMNVTEEPGGLIRMVESDVPRDLLDVRIHHMSFVFSGPWRDVLNGPKNASHLVLSTPEVKAFRRAHNIGPF